MLCPAVLHRRAGDSYPRAVLVGMCFLNTLGNLVEKIKDLRPLSVFSRYGSAIEDGIEWASFGGIVLCSLLLVLLATLLFEWHDIYT